MPAATTPSADQRNRSRQPIVVSYSELDTFRQCPLKHALAYKQRWTRPSEEGDPRDLGTLWHLVMETHYRVIRDAQTATQAATGSWVIRADDRLAVLAAAREAVIPLLSDPRTGQQTPDQEKIEWMYDGHCQMYGIDPNWRILAVEHAPVVPLRNERGHRTRFHLKSKIDLMIWDRTTQQTWIVDHKSSSNLKRQMEIDLDDQFGLYTWILRELGTECMGSIYNGARTDRLKRPMTLEERFSRVSMFRTQIELTNLALDAYRVARVAYSSINDVPYSSPDPRQCGWKCDFKDAHLLMRKGTNPRKALTGYGFHRNPNRH